MNESNGTKVFEHEPAESAKGITKISPAPENPDDAKPAKKEEPKKETAEEKKQNEREAFKLIFGYVINGHRIKFILACICTLGGVVTDVLLPIFSGTVINAIIEGDFDLVKKLCLYMFLISLVS